LESENDMADPRDGNTQTVLLTGATGFIGKHLSLRLVQAGFTVRSFSRSYGQDILSRDSFQPFLQEPISAVIHLAGITYVPDSWAKSDAFYSINTLGTQRALEFCHASGARMIYVSAYVYGVPAYLPIDETHPVAPNNPYAHSKWLGEELCRFYAHHKGVDVVIFRPFNLFGPGQDDRFLIPTILRQAKNGQQITVRDDTPKRDYLHVDDFVDACVLALGRKERFAIFNVGSGKSISVREIIDLVGKHSNDRVRFVSLGETRPNEIMDTVADCAAIRKALGWSPKSTLGDFVKEELGCVSC
jgi:nucleoside-diphosphate-sugar epimerase